jgi:hypothetical protein
VQTLARRGAPFTMIRSRWMLGFQRRRERRCEWEILFPNPGVFPQISQTEAITTRQATRLPGAFSRGRSARLVDRCGRRHHLKLDANAAGDGGLLGLDTVSESPCGPAAVLA